MREGMPLGRPDWLSILQLPEVEVLRALCDWCRRQIDKPIQRIGARIDVAVIEWYGRVYAWFWSSARRPAFLRLPAHVILVDPPRSIEKLVQHFRCVVARDDRLLDYYLSWLPLSKHTSGVQTQAVSAIETLATCLARQCPPELGPTRLAGLILLSQAVARQVQAAGEIGHSIRKEASR